METWKALLALTGVLVVAGVLASVSNVSLASPAGIGLLIGAVIVSVLFYVLSRYGYRIGRSIGESMQEDE